MTTSTSALIGFAVIAALITGCTATATAHDTNPLVSTKTVATAPATAAVAAPLAGDINGDGKLDGWEREHLVAPTYTLKDGTKVVLPALGKPLPAVIVKAVQAHVVELGSLNTTSAESMDVISNARADAIDAESKRIRRSIIPATYAYDGMAGYARWCVAGAASNLGCFAHESEAMGAINAWIGGQSQYVAIAFG